MAVSKDYYYKLGSEKPQERIEAAKNLIQNLIDESEKSEWEYALNRLLKGIITTRQSAKFGFSMCLGEIVTELLAREEITIRSYLDKLNDITQLKASLKGKEERAYLFGKLFGLQILINNGSIYKAETEEKNKFVNSLIELSIFKNWLRESSLFTLFQFIQNLDQEENKETLLKVLQSLNNHGLNLSTESCAIYLIIQPEIRSETLSKLTNAKINWKNGDPLNKNNLYLLSKVLKDIEVPQQEEESNNNKKSNWTAQLPFVWDVIISKLINTPEKSVSNGKKRVKMEQEVTIKEFFKIVVDESLFSEKSSHERKYWGFEIFQKFLKLIDNEDVKYLFTGNFLRCLINQVSQSNRLLNSIAKSTIKEIVNKCQAEPEVSSIILDCLISNCWNFDLITKTNTIDTILNIKSEYVNSYTILFISKFNSFVDSQSTINQLKSSNDNILKWYLDKIGHLVKSSKFIDNDTIESILNMLISNSFFKSKLSNNIVKLSQEKLNSILSAVVSSKNGTQSWSLYVYNKIQSYKKTKECLIEFDESITTIEQDTRKLIKGLKSSDYIFELLFSMCLIQMYMEEPDVVEIINDLRDIYENSKNTETNSVMLTEILLSFLSKKTPLFKELSNIVWEGYLCESDENGLRLNEECFKLLFDILETRENKEGQQKLFEGEDEMEIDEKGAENENEENGENEDDEEEESEEEEEESEGDELAEIDKETNLKLAKALGIPTSDSGEVKFDELDDLSSNDEYESDSMDDEQMMAMDDQLSKIFKDRQDILNNVQTGNKRKLEKLEAKDQIIYFKNRVLNLLETFVIKNPNSEFNLVMLPVLIRLMTITTDKNLGNKTHKLIKTRISKTKLEKGDEEDLFRILKALQNDYGSIKSGNNIAIQALNQSCIIISKNLLFINSENLVKIMNVYFDSMKSWILNEDSKISSSLFIDFINWINTYKQAGISLNKALAVAAQTLRNSLKAEFKAAAERRGACDAKVITYKNGEASEAKPLKAIDN
ncbi:unnamed protein product [Candida verbasci]|uniref:DNA polymerase V n=1 Tax=Candida verbasci TaxID=1227364 RepID=A0A9W4U222_9ASCO|nr:unnamed protein product [Candida verbasci]